MPGSRRCACRSTRPGATRQPDASMTSSPPGIIPRSTLEITPSRTRTSASPRRPPGNEIILPPFTSIPSAMTTPEKVVENRHPYRNASRDLPGDHRLDLVRDARFDLHPPVHGPRMHNKRLALEVRPARLCQACLLYTSDAADDLLCVDLGGRRIIKKKK